MSLENIDKKQLFREIAELMQPLYFPVHYDEDYIQKLAQHEYELFCKAISARYDFDYNKYIFEHDGHSPFDVIYDDVICELKSRMRRDPFLLQSEAIRQHLVILVRQAVVRAGGCLGTFYKNLQVHHMEYNSGDMYDDVPAVVFRRGMACTAGGYESAMLYDIYLAPDDRLMCTVDDKDCSEYDVPFDTLLLESLFEFVHWLRINHFCRIQTLPIGFARSAVLRMSKPLLGSDQTKIIASPIILELMTMATTGVIIVRNTPLWYSLQVAKTASLLQSVKVYG